MIKLTYAKRMSSKGKSDLILDGVLRMERYLQEMSNMIVSSQNLVLRNNTVL